MNLDDDRPICDFCELMIEEGESLTEINVGEPPEPEPYRLSEVGSRGSGRGSMHVLGKPVGFYQAMYVALEQCPDIEVNESMRVQEVKSVGGESHYADLENGSELTDFETRTRDDKVAVSMKISPKSVDYEPDAEVCPNCAEFFRSLGE